MYYYMSLDIYYLELQWTYSVKMFIKITFSVLILCPLTLQENENNEESICNKLENQKGEIINDLKVNFNASDIWRDGYCSRAQYKVPDFQSQGRRISEVKCLEYLWETKFLIENKTRKLKCRKNKNNPLVTGGKPTPISEYAHMGGVGWISSENPNFWVFKCGASLISKRFMLSAAHCSRVPRSDRTVAKQEPSIVRLGDENILGQNDPGSSDLYLFLLSHYRDVPIERFIVHEKYRPPRQYYDIALIELIRDVSFDVAIRPACLWSSCDTSSFSSVSVTGWGIDDLATYTTTSKLQVAEIKLLESAKCDELMQTKFSRNWNGVSDHQICAGHMAGGIDTCQGDSGGPLQYRINLTQIYPMHYLIGITSFGYGCGRTNTPGIYTRAASFINWIEQNVWNNNLKS